MRLIMPRCAVGSRASAAAQSRSSRGSKRRSSWVRRTRSRMAARSGRSTPRVRAWTSTLPSAEASAGPASTGSPHASAVSWQSRSLRAPPPTTWTTATSRPARAAACAHVPAVGQRQAVEDAAGDLERGERDRLAGLAGERHEARGHGVVRGAGRQQPRVVDVDDRAQRRGVRQRLQQARQVGAWHAGVGPGPQRLRQHPQPDHVLEEADGAVDAALVGEVGGPGRLGEHRLVELEADERPGARGDVRRRLVADGHGDDRGGGVVGADRDDRHVGGEAQLVGDGGEQGPDHVPGGAQGRQERGRRCRPGRPGRSPRRASGRRTARSWRRWCVRRRPGRSASSPAGPGAGAASTPARARGSRPRPPAGRSC